MKEKNTKKKKKIRAMRLKEDKNPMTKLRLLSKTTKSTNPNLRTNQPIKEKPKSWLKRM